ncbi:hypothetical protein [Nocardioides cynanchi]|uniref:hypothetical protein n=1 Tax=Nocardioides cynanchi TaxID=2558918 RepID=UPI001247E190|nr:hypothetical protein [Nocardioides cynanchi]
MLHGQDWLTHPETVVADDGHELVTLLRPGTPFTFHDHPHGPHPWAAGHTSWEGPVLLRATRAGDRYGAWWFHDRVTAYRSASVAPATRAVQPGAKTTAPRSDDPDPRIATPSTRARSRRQVQSRRRRSTTANSAFVPLR